MRPEIMLLALISVYHLNHIRVQFLHPYLNQYHYLFPNRFQCLNRFLYLSLYPYPNLFQYLSLYPYLNLCQYLNQFPCLSLYQCLNQSQYLGRSQFQCHCRSQRLCLRHPCAHNSAQREWY